MKAVKSVAAAMTGPSGVNGWVGNLLLVCNGQSNRQSK